MKDAEVCKKGETKIDGQCMKVGYKVKFIEGWAVGMDDYIEKGETGTITVINDDIIVLSIKLDKHHEDMEYWGNEVHIYAESEDDRKPSDYVKVIKKK
jgi:hypothetical protein